MPHSYVIIFMLLIAVSIMTYLIPANEYDRVKNESGNTTVVVESYHAVDGEPVPVWKIPNFVMQGLSKQADIIFPLLVIAGSLEVILSTGMFHAYCGRMAMKCKGKEKLFIPAILLIFAVIGITQSTNKFIGFAPLGVMLAATLGYDAIVGVAIVLLGVGIGFSTGILAPTTAVAQDIAELPAYSGMWLRIVSFFLFYAVTAAYIIWYGERCKKDPKKSVIYGVEGAKNMTSAALIVGLSATVALILQSAKVLDTVVYGLANMLSLFPNFLKPAVMLIMNVIVNGFVTSGTGQAAVVMPVMVPLADVAGVTRQTAVLAYKFGDGFCNYVLPHASALMGFLGATGIGYDRWMKFMGKLFGIWMLLGSAILIFGYFVQYA